MIMYVFRKYFFGSPPRNRDSGRSNKDLNISHIVLDSEEKKEIADHISQRNSVSGNFRDAKLGRSSTKLVRDDESKNKEEEKAPLLKD
jgi:hypothetical protein